MKGSRAGLERRCCQRAEVLPVASYLAMGSTGHKSFLHMGPIFAETWASASSSPTCSLLALGLRKAVALVWGPVFGSLDDFSV